MLAPPGQTRLTPTVVLARLLAIIAPPLLVALLRPFPAPSLAEGLEPAWLTTAAVGGAALLAGVATVAKLARGLASGRRVPLITATGFGALAVGLAVAAIRALGAPEQFPDPGLAPAALLGGALLAAAAILPEARVGGGGARAAAGIAVFLGVEAALGAGTLLAALVAPAAPWVLGAASFLTGAAAVDGWRRTEGAPDDLAPWLLAGGLAALGLARPGSAEGLIGIAAAAAAMVVAIRPALSVAVGRELAEPETLLLDLAADLRADREVDLDEAIAAQLGTPWARPRQLEAPADREEALRMARELRGTIEELMRAQRTIELQRVELERAAKIDPLTGVLSRRASLERLRIETGEARRYAHPLAIILLDIDGFGAINREHGLVAGDAVLKELALRLRLRSRAADALGRVGGDSFVAVLPHTDERGAAVFADALRRRVSSRPILTDVGELRLTVSIGVAFVRPGMELSDEGVLAAADEALASARAAGGNRIAFDRAHGLIRLDERRQRDGA